jgi:hypothetical protein
LLGPTADDETLRSAFPSGRPHSERGALSDLRMTWVMWGGRGNGWNLLNSWGGYIFKICELAMAALRFATGGMKTGAMGAMLEVPVEAM